MFDGEIRVSFAQMQSVLELKPPSFKTRNFFLRRELKKIKTRTDFRENFGKNKNPRAQRAKIFGGFQKLPN